MIVKYTCISGIFRIKPSNEREYLKMLVLCVLYKLLSLNTWKVSLFLCTSCVNCILQVVLGWMFIIFFSALFLRLKTRYTSLVTSQQMDHTKLYNELVRSRMTLVRSVWQMLSSVKLCNNTDKIYHIFSQYIL